MEKLDHEVRKGFESVQNLALVISRMLYLVPKRSVAEDLRPLLHLFLLLTPVGISI